MASLYWLLFTCSVLLIPIHANHQSKTTTAGLKFVQTGPSSSSQLPYWELAYYAENYLPICGTSMEIEGPIPWTNSFECEPAMKTYSTTSSGAALYDTSGNATNQKIGDGSMVCMCFSVLHTTGKPLDICLLVGEEGEVRIRGSVAVGVHSPATVAGKALPSCEEVGKSVNTVVSPTVTATVSVTVAPSPTAVRSGGDGLRNQGIGKETLLGLGVGLLVVL